MIETKPKWQSIKALPEFVLATKNILKDSKKQLHMMESNQDKGEFLEEKIITRYTEFHEKNNQEIQTLKEPLQKWKGANIFTVITLQGTPEITDHEIILQSTTLSSNGNYAVLYIDEEGNFIQLGFIPQNAEIVGLGDLIIADGGKHELVIKNTSTNEIYYKDAENPLPNDSDLSNFFSINVIRISNPLPDNAFIGAFGDFREDGNPFADFIIEKTDTNEVFSRSIDPGLPSNIGLPGDLNDIFQPPSIRIDILIAQATIVGLGDFDATDNGRAEILIFDAASQNLYFRNIEDGLPPFPPNPADPFDLLDNTNFIIDLTGSNLIPVALGDADGDSSSGTDSFEIPLENDQGKVGIENDANINIKNLNILENDNISLNGLFDFTEDNKITKEDFLASVTISNDGTNTTVILDGGGSIEILNNIFDASTLPLEVVVP